MHAAYEPRHRVISYQEMFQDAIDGASVHPRDVGKKALKQNAAAVIMELHNPSGVGASGGFYAQSERCGHLNARFPRGSARFANYRVASHGELV